MLGIANPNLISVDELRKNSMISEARILTKLIVIGVDILMEREIVLHLARNAINVVEKTTSAKCVNPVRDLTSLSQSVTQESQDRLIVNVHAEFMRLMNVKMTWKT